MKGMVEATEAVLSQGLEMLKGLSPESYGQALSIANGATIGGHYRHALEHFRQLLKGLDEGIVDYDARNRDVLLETDRDEAMRATKELVSYLKNLSVHGSEDPVEIKCGITYGEQDAGTASSTLGREIIFCISHAVHHYAIISLMLRSLGQPVAEGFGVAPSTVRHRLQIAGTH